MRLANQYETFLRSMVLLRGDHLSGEQLGQIVERAVASASPEERRNPVPSTDAINRLQQFLIQVAETGRPHNVFSAEAARAAQAAGGADGLRGAGFGTFDTARAGSSARFRELAAREGSDGGKGGSAVTVGSGGVTVEFARSFAGTGVVGGSLRTFAAVELDRGTYDAFRKEGFSREQITDSAKDSKALGWKGKDDLSIAQHASTPARKAAVATEQAKTPEERAKRLEREAELEKKNEARPDNDPQKQHDRRFWKRRHEDHLRHSAKVGLGTESRQHDAAVPASGGGASRKEQDKVMAKDGERAVKNAAMAKVRVASGFEVEPETPPPAKPAPVKVATAKPAAAPAPTG